MTLFPSDSGGYKGFSVDSDGNLKVSLGAKVAGENVDFDRLQVAEVYNYQNMTASNRLKVTAGIFGGIIVNSNSAGAVITIKDSAASDGTGGSVIATLTLASAHEGMPIPYGVAFNNGLWVGITGTANITVRLI